jgi:hypothetical protein
VEEEEKEKKITGRCNNAFLTPALLRDIKKHTHTYINTSNQVITRLMYVNYYTSTFIKKLV